MVKLSVRGGAINALYFYPKAIQDKAIEIGLTDRDVMNRKRKRFMISFYIVMLVSLVLIIRVWNSVTDFKTAYLLALLFLLGMNWYDEIVIDKIWVGCSKFWILPGVEDIPYVQTWRQVFKKRIFMSIVWIV